MLRVGVYATRLHSGLWCLTCLRKHQLTCQVSRPN